MELHLDALAAKHAVVLVNHCVNPTWRFTLIWASLLLCTRHVSTCDTGVQHYCETEHVWMLYVLRCAAVNTF